MERCFRRRPGASVEGSRRARRTSPGAPGRSGERLLDVDVGACRAPPRPGIGKAALELLTGAGRGATPRRGAGQRLVVQLLLVLVGEIGERRLAAAELLAQLVELLLRHGAELPEPPLERAPSLLAASRRIEQGQAGSDQSSPEQPLGGRVTAALDIDHFRALGATHAASYSPASGSSSAATSAGLSAE